VIDDDDDEEEEKEEKEEGWMLDDDNQILLLQTLNTVRTKLAGKNKRVTICSGGVCFDMSKMCPTTLEELESIESFGARRIAKYGNDFIEAVKAFLKEHNIVKPSAKSFELTMYGQEQPKVVRSPHFPQNNSAPVAYTKKRPRPNLMRTDDSDDFQDAGSNKLPSWSKKKK